MYHGPAEGAQWEVDLERSNDNGFSPLFPNTSDTHASHAHNFHGVALFSLNHLFSASLFGGGGCNPATRHHSNGVS